MIMQIFFSVCVYQSDSLNLFLQVQLLHQQQQDRTRSWAFGHMYAENSMLSDYTMQLCVLLGDKCLNSQYKPLGLKWCSYDGYASCVEEGNVNSIGLDAKSCTGSNLFDEYVLVKEIVTCRASNNSEDRF